MQILRIQIAEVRGEIEKIEGRKKFLEYQSSLSTIKIRLQAPAVFSSNSSGFFSQVKQSFGRGFDAALSFVINFNHGGNRASAVFDFRRLADLPRYKILFEEERKAEIGARHRARRNQKRVRKWKKFFKFRRRF